MENRRTATADEAKALGTGATAQLTPIEVEATFGDTQAATAPPASRTVAAGLEYLAKLEDDNKQLTKERDQQEREAKLAALEIEDLRSRLNASESRVAELQAHRDEAVRKEAGLKATLEAVIRTALFGADPHSAIERMTMNVDLNGREHIAQAKVG